MILGSHALAYNCSRTKCLCKSVRKFDPNTDSYKMNGYWTTFPWWLGWLSSLLCHSTITGSLYHYNMTPLTQFYCRYRCYCDESCDFLQNIDFARNPFALILVVVIMFFYIVGIIWGRRLDLRDIKRASIIPLCGPNGSFKYEITIKTAAGMGSGMALTVINLESVYNASVSW